MQFDSVFQGLCLHSAFGVNMCVISVLKQHRTLANFLSGGFGLPFRFKMHLFGVELDSFKTLKVHFDSVFQHSRLPLHAWGEHVFMFSAKTAQDARQFLVWAVFVPLFVSK